MCNFFIYEYKVSGGSKSRAERFYIYIEEYEAPLEIDNIIFNKANEYVLYSINKGNKITVSALEEKGKLDLNMLSYKIIMFYLMTTIF